VLDLAAVGLGGAHIFAVRGNFVAQAMVEQSLAHWAKSGFQPISWAIWAAWLKGGVSISSRYCWFWAAARLATSSTHSPMWLLAQPAKAVEGGKELVVPAEARSGNKAAHGEGVDEAVVEVLVGRVMFPESWPPDQRRCAGRLGEAERGRVDAEAVLAGGADESSPRRPRRKGEHAGRRPWEIGQKARSASGPFARGLVGAGGAGFRTRRKRGKAGTGTGLAWAAARARQSEKAKGMGAWLPSSVVRASRSCHSDEDLRRA
jgi:hypothetical protein